MNFQKISFSLLFILIGIGLIWYAFSRPCDIGPIIQNVEGTSVEVEQPAQLDKLVCLSTDYVTMLSLLLGVAMIFPGVGGLFKGLTEGPQVATKKKRR